MDKKKVKTKATLPNVSFIEAVYSEYEKSYLNTKPGQIYPRFLTEEQIKWIYAVLNKKT